MAALAPCHWRSGHVATTMRAHRAAQHGTQGVWQLRPQPLQCLACSFAGMLASERRRRRIEGGKCRCHPRTRGHRARMQAAAKDAGRGQKAGSEAEDFFSDIRKPPPGQINSFVPGASLEDAKMFAATRTIAVAPWGEDVNPKPIFAVSDGTGQVAKMIAEMGFRQFGDVQKAQVDVISGVRTEEDVRKAVEQAANYAPDESLAIEQAGAMIIFSLSTSLGNFLVAECGRQGVPCINAMGSVVLGLEDCFQVERGKARKENISCAQLSETNTGEGLCTQEGLQMCTRIFPGGLFYCMPFRSREERGLMPELAGFLSDLLKLCYTIKVRFVLHLKYDRFCELQQYNCFKELARNLSFEISIFTMSSFGATKQLLGLQWTPTVLCGTDKLVINGLKHMAKNMGFTVRSHRRLNAAFPYRRHVADEITGTYIYGVVEMILLRHRRTVNELLTANIPRMFDRIAHDMIEQDIDSCFLVTEIGQVLFKSPRVEMNFEAEFILIPHMRHPLTHSFSEVLDTEPRQEGDLFVTRPIAPMPVPATAPTVPTAPTATAPVTSAEA
ncbi:PDRP1 [Symbiodinium sp. CCMP2592]|nr:PDRP1 [Symbiodinium sp. CCMP2592]